MFKFQKGEKVILDSFKTRHGYYGIHHENFGKEFFIYNMENYDDEANYALSRTKNAHPVYYCYESMLKSATPLTPFERRVKRYIDKELRNA